ncbi:MAG: hypothetical protein LBV34_20395 [Nocardiopsaceae bacterium]|nr:hypothetical protein [Nocardiopsaceae bacterium]
MGRTSLYDKTAVDLYIAKQSGLITRSHALACGLTREALRHRLRVDGPWQFLMPGVYATFTGAITRAHKETAALLYAGPDSAITGQSAMAAHGLKDLGRPIVDVLVPATCQRRDQDFVHLLRTWKMPPVLFVSGEVRFVPVARAVADAARQLRDIREVRSVVASAVQWGKTSVADLSAELRQGPSSGSARFRMALLEVADGVRSTVEADLRKLIKKAGLPDPLYNPKLYAGAEFIAMPDAWWPEAGVAVEVDSRQWHLSPADWERTMARHSRMTALGITVLHYPPSRLHAQPRVVIMEMRSALEIGRARPRLPIRTVSSRA